jgi:hypothetical protein
LCLAAHPAGDCFQAESALPLHEHRIEDSPRGNAIAVRLAIARQQRSQRAFVRGVTVRRN